MCSIQRGKETEPRPEEIEIEIGELKLAKQLVDSVRRLQQQGVLRLWQDLQLRKMGKGEGLEEIIPGYFTTYSGAYITHRFPGLEIWTPPPNLPQNTLKGRLFIGDLPIDLVVSPLGSFQDSTTEIQVATAIAVSFPPENDLPFISDEPQVLLYPPKPSPDQSPTLIHILSITWDAYGDPERLQVGEIQRIQALQGLIYNASFQPNEIQPTPHKEPRTPDAPIYIPTIFTFVTWGNTIYVATTNPYSSEFHAAEEGAEESPIMTSPEWDTEDIDPYTTASRPFIPILRKLKPESQPPPGGKIMQEEENSPPLPHFELIIPLPSKEEGRQILYALFEHLYLHDPYLPPEVIVHTDQGPYKIKFTEGLASSPNPIAN